MRGAPWRPSNSRAAGGTGGEYGFPSAPIPYAARDGRVLYYEGAMQDVTARKEAEESLRTSRLQLSQAMDLARTSIGKPTRP